MWDAAASIELSHDAVRDAGIEPAPDAWEAPVLPLNYDRIISNSKEIFYLLLLPLIYLSFYIFSIYTHLT